MNIVIVTTDEPLYIPLTFHRLLETRFRDSVRLVVSLPPTARSRTWGTVISEQMHFGFVYFVIRSLQFLLYRILSRAGLSSKGRYYGVEAVCRAYGVPYAKFKSINSRCAIAAIDDMKPDIVVSISASQIFNKAILGVPSYATINVHNAPLPKYQGLMPSFWVLHNDENETATTVHLMDDGIDTGDIIIQRKVLIDPDETLDSLIKKTKMSTVDALLDTFSLFEQYDGHPPTKENKKDDATYFGFPSKEDIREFKRKGKKLLWKNIY